MAKNTKQDKLERMRAKMGQQKAQASGDYWKPEPDSKQIIRILPEVGNMEYFWQQKGTHYPPGEGNESVVCPKFTTEGMEDCPVCELSRALSEGSAEQKKLAKKWYVRRAYHMNIIIRDKQQESGYRGPFTWTPGVLAFEDLFGIINDDDYGDITLPEEGFDIQLQRIGAGFDTKYKVIPRREPSPILAEPADTEKLLEKARDLSKILDSIPSHAEIAEAAGISEFFDEDEAYEEEEFEDFE
jgi:hypothetical protein